MSEMRARAAAAAAAAAAAVVAADAEAVNAAMGEHQGFLLFECRIRGGVPE